MSSTRVNRPLLIASATIGVGLAFSSVMAQASPSLASQRHARCGFDREVTAVQTSNTRVNHRVVQTEPPPRDLAQLGCYDQIRGVMASITAFGTLPGPVGNILTNFACTAIQQSAAAVQERFEVFSQTPFGAGVAAGIGAAQGPGAALPITITPSTFLSTPPAPVQPVSNPLYNSPQGGGAAGGTQPTTPALPQGSSTNIFGGSQ